MKTTSRSVAGTNGHSSDPMALVLAKLNGVTQSSPDQWSARCPAHADNRASLSVKRGEEGKVLLNCHAGCETADIVAAMGLTMKDLFLPTKAKGSRTNGTGKIVAEYSYGDERGELLYQILRTASKGFKARRPDGNGGWVWKVNGVRRVLYRLPELLAADPKTPVYIVEGEKDVDRLRGLGLVATCNPFGAGKWSADFNESLRRRNVVIIPDNDEAGREHAEGVARNLTGIAEEVRVLTLPGLQEHGDVSDWLDAGGNKRQLLRCTKAATTWKKRIRKAGVSDGTHSQGVGGVDATEAPGTHSQCVRGAKALTQFKRVPFPECLKTFTRWLGPSIAQPLEAALAVIATNPLEGDPVWLMLIGASGAGKTEIVRSASEWPAVVFLSTLTRCSLITGWEADDQKELSLLPKLHEKTLVVKDYSTILSLPRDARAEILAQLRDAYDGESARSFGTGRDGNNMKRFRSRFNLLACCTSSIHHFYAAEAALGERFLKLEMPTEGDAEAVTRALTNTNGEVKMRSQLRDAACGVLANANTKPPEVPKRAKTALRDMALFLAKARCPVHRGCNRQIESIPQPESGTRVVKELVRLAGGVAMLWRRPIIDKHALEIAGAATWSSIPPNRRIVLSLLYVEKHLSAKDIRERVKLSSGAIKYLLEDMEAIGLVEHEARKVVKTEEHVYRPAKKTRQLMVRLQPYLPL